MGGSLQPFFAERNLAAQTAMSSNNYRAPEDALGKGGETDVALAVSIAAMEHQQLQRRTQEAQRLGYASHDRAEPSTESARRQTYQGAQQLPPLQYRRTSQPSLQSGTPVPVGPQSVSHQSSAYRQHATFSEPALQAGVGTQVSKPKSSLAPVHAQRQPRSTPQGMPQSSESQESVSEHRRSLYSVAVKPSNSKGPATSIGTTQQISENQKHRCPTPLRINAVAHITDNLPLPTSPLSGRAEGNTLQPTQSWEAGSGADWDAEISNRMSGQQAQPLTPRVNAMAAVTQPVESPETSRARLEQRLKLYGLCERKIKGDGACQFRSISDQLYRTQDYHHEVRRVAVHQLRSNFQEYSQFVPSDYWKYVYEMEQSDTWGDHICLQAIADAYGLKINIITSYPAAETCFIGITPKTQTCHRVLYLSFWAEIHYQSVYPISDPPTSEKFLGSKKLARWLA